jgi:hypothetical protein
MSRMPSEKRFRLIYGGESGQPPAAPADSDGDEYTAALAALTEVLAGPDGAHDADARERAATIAREVMGTFVSPTSRRATPRNRIDPEPCRGVSDLRPFQGHVTSAPGVAPNLTGVNPRRCGWGARVRSRRGRVGG